MFKKIKMYFAKLKQTKEQKAKLLQAQKYYKIVREGAIFIKYIKDDLSKNKNDISRQVKRGLQKSLQKGKLTTGIVNYYQQKIENVLRVIEIELSKLNAKKKGGDK